MRWGLLFTFGFQFTNSQLAYIFFMLHKCRRESEKKKLINPQPTTREWKQKEAFSRPINGTWNHTNEIDGKLLKTVGLCGKQQCDSCLFCEKAEMICSISFWGWKFFDLWADNTKLVSFDYKLWYQASNHKVN